MGGPEGKRKGGTSPHRASEAMFRLYCRIQPAEILHGEKQDRTQLRHGNWLFSGLGPGRVHWKGRFRGRRALRTSIQPSLDSQRRWSRGV